eukprot:COSAG02_NODE_4373_length_5439_cov_4.438764_4_plen_455_part_00
MIWCRRESDATEQLESPPTSPVNSPPALRQRRLRRDTTPAERPAERPATSPDVLANTEYPRESSEVSGISSIRRRLFAAMPQSEAKQRWKSGNDCTAEPQLVRRRRQAVARKRRLKRCIKSTAEIVVDAAAAGDVAALQHWMRIDDSYGNCEAVLPHANNPTSPLVQASKNGHVDCCQLLLRHGARVDDVAAAAPGWSALMEAAAVGRVNTVNALCGFGANPLLSSTKTGSTALSLAAVQGHAGAVAGLLALGGLLPRAVAQAASSLGEVAAALNALLPMRQVMAQKDRDLWVVGRQCDSMKQASKRSEQACTKRVANRESRVESAMLARAGFVWQKSGPNIRLRRDFFAWRAHAAVHAAEKAHLRDVEARRRHDRAYAVQEFALMAAAAARQDMDETVERLQRSVETAIRRLKLAKSRAGLVGMMVAHADVNGLTPVCHGKEPHKYHSRYCQC